MINGLMTLGKTSNGAATPVTLGLTILTGWCGIRLTAETCNGMTAVASRMEVAAAAEKAVATMAEVVLTMVEVVVVVALVVQAGGRAVAGQAGVVAGAAAAAAKERKGIPTGRLGRADTARPGSSRAISYSLTALILR